MKRNQKKSFALLLALILVLTMTIVGTLSYLHTASNTVTNSFEAGEVRCEVVCDPNSQTSTVTNTGTVDAYIRVAVVANWVPDGSTASSIVHSNALKATEVSSNWTEDNGYYYYADPVRPSGTVTLTVEKLEGVQPEGYKANVQILAEAIQVGGGAAYNAWGVELYGKNG